MHVEGNDVLRKLLTSEVLKLWLSNLLRGSEMFKGCRLCNKSNESPYLLFFYNIRGLSLRSDEYCDKNFAP